MNELIKSLEAIDIDSVDKEKLQLFLVSLNTVSEQLSGVFKEEKYKAAPDQLNYIKKQIAACSFSSEEYTLLHQKIAALYDEIELVAGNSFFMGQEGFILANIETAITQVAKDIVHFVPITQSMIQLCQRFIDDVTTDLESPEGLHVKVATLRPLVESLQEKHEEFNDNLKLEYEFFTQIKEKISQRQNSYLEDIPHLFTLGISSKLTKGTFFFTKSPGQLLTERLERRFALLGYTRQAKAELPQFNDKDQNANSALSY